MEALVQSAARMNDVASSYKSYKEREFEYEKAYAVWEYASTPYLRKDQSEDPGSETGDMPGGSVEDLSSLDAPDAAQEYARILAEYEKSDRAYQDKRSRYESQDNAEKLAADAGYGERREDLVRKTESYVRTAQAAAQIEEKVGRLREDADKAKARYESAKEALFFSKGGLTAEETAVRDQIMGRMILAPQYYFQSFVTWKIFHMLPDQQALNDILYIYGHLNPSLIDRAGDDSFNAMVYLAAQNYQEGISSSLKVFMDFSEMANSLYEVAGARAEYAAKQSALDRYDRARNLSPLGAADGDAVTVMLSAYGLAGEDLGHLYDDVQGGTSAAGATDGMEAADVSLEGKEVTDEFMEEGVNINTIRRETERLDADGRGLKAVRRGREIWVLDSYYGSPVSKYSIDDPSFRLRDESGALVDPKAVTDEKIKYSFYDYTYSVSEAAVVLRDAYAAKRSEYRDEYESYARNSVASGGHDATVVLRDEESMYWGLLGYARDFGRDPDNDGSAEETRQRSFDGYRTIVSELVHSDSGLKSVDDRIVDGLMSQNRAFQEQTWRLQLAEFREKKTRWMETVAFIEARGGREWTDALNRMTNEWAKWRISAREEIETGEKSWMNELSGFNAAMGKWQDRTSKSASKETAERALGDLEGEIDGYSRALRKNLPVDFDLRVDTDGIISRAMKNGEVPGLGVLLGSMNRIDVVAGFSDFLKLNLSPALNRNYMASMKEYGDQMKVMQNLRVIDAFNGMIKQFNEQLEKQNDRTYADVDRKMRAQYMAPFFRMVPANLWGIEIVTGVSLFSGKNKDLIVFDDYHRFSTNAVALKQLKKPGGGKLDFNNASTYKNLDPNELDVYVGLETDHLKTEIDRVMGRDGAFSKHAGYEMSRLDIWFRELNKKYTHGVELSKMKWYQMPEFAWINTGISVLGSVFSFVPAVAVVNLLYNASIGGIIGADKGGFWGAFTGTLSGIGNSVVSGFSHGAANMNMSYSRKDGFEGSMGSGNLNVGYSKSGGFSGGINLNSSNNTGSFGLKYSKDEGVGVDGSYDMQDRPGQTGYSQAPKMMSSGTKLKSGYNKADGFMFSAKRENETGGTKDSYGFLYSDRKGYGGAYDYSSGGKLNMGAEYMSKSEFGGYVEYDNRLSKDTGMYARMDFDKTGVKDFNGFFKLSTSDIEGGRASARLGVDFDKRGMEHAGASLEASGLTTGVDYVRGTGYTLSVGASTGLGFLGSFNTTNYNFSRDGGYRGAEIKAGVSVDVEWFDRAQKAADRLRDMDRYEEMMGGLLLSTNGGPLDGFKELGNILANGVQNLGQRVGNLFSHGVFGTDDSFDVKRAIFAERFDKAVEEGEIEEGSLEYYQGKYIARGLTEAEMEQMEMLQETDGMQMVEHGSKGNSNKNQGLIDGYNLKTGQQNYLKSSNYINNLYGGKQPIDTIGGVNELMQFQFEIQTGPERVKAGLTNTVLNTAVDVIEDTLTNSSNIDFQSLYNKIRNSKLPPEISIANPNYNPGLKSGEGINGKAFNYQTIVLKTNGATIDSILSYEKGSVGGSILINIEDMVDAFLKGPKQLESFYESTKGYKIDVFGVKIWNDWYLDRMNENSYLRLKQLCEQYHNSGYNK